MNKKYRLTQNQISTTLSNESVILNHKKGTYYSLNEVGTCVWTELEKHNVISFIDLKKTILENFEIDEITCENDLEELLNDLLDEKLLEKVD